MDYKTQDNENVININDSDSLDDDILMPFDNFRYVYLQFVNLDFVIYQATILPFFKISTQSNLNHWSFHSIDIICIYNAI